MNSNPTLEHRFKEYEKSGNYDKRLFWDEGCVKIVLNGNYPLLRAFACLLSGIVCIAIDFTQSFPQAQYMPSLFGVVLLLIGLGALRGNQTLSIYEEHLEVRYDRMNYRTPDIHVKSLIKDITFILYYPRIVERMSSSDYSERLSSREREEHRSYEISVTGIVLENPANILSLKNSKFGIPLVEIQSNTKNEAEELAKALNFIILNY